MNKYEESKRFADKSTKAVRETIERSTVGRRRSGSGREAEYYIVRCRYAGTKNIKLIDMAHANADAVFDLAYEIASAKAPFDLVAIWSAHAKRKFEMMREQTRELTELGQKLASRNTETVSQSVNEAFRHRT
jgi:hypothetical protein